jgi:predicted amidohydrolase YtcJ
MDVLSFDMHDLWFNTAAMRLAGVSATTPDLNKTQYYERDPDRARWPPCSASGINACGRNTCRSAAGFDMHIHVDADGSTRTVLDALERARDRIGNRGTRHTICHNTMVHPDDIPRYGQLGVIANATPLWGTDALRCIDALPSELGQHILREQRVGHVVHERRVAGDGPLRCGRTQKPGGARQGGHAREKSRRSEAEAGFV